MNCWRCFPLFFIGILTTDEWGSHIRYVIEGDSSIFIQHIECMRILIKHLTRRAICFPHSVNFIKNTGTLSKNTCSTNWISPNHIK
ncbi:iso-IS1 InsB protein, transposase [Escherichia coli O26:H11 str. CVM9942]|nr:iso-IS1 InsB protein, transposase [Escherichia coli O26:H11 str. CVM9942]EJE85065.1 iso-IS1 InsB protein, transposase [Escherichia coli O111:H11 str. CVM9455]